MVRYIAEEDEEYFEFQKNQPPAGYLILVVNSRANQTIPLQRGIQLGRDRDNTVVISDQKVSRHHASITASNAGEVLIEDHSSSNGTYVNNVLIRQPTLLHNNDQLRIGDTQFLFSLNDIPLNSPIKTIAKSRTPTINPEATTRIENNVPTTSLIDDPKAIWTALGCILIIVIVLVILLAFLLGVYLAGPA